MRATRVAITTRAAWALPPVAGCAIAALLALLGLSLMAAPPARAQWDGEVADRSPDGVLSLQVLISDAAPSRPGGQLALDLVRRPPSIPWLRGGGFVGLGILGGTPDTTRVQLLVGATAILGLFPDAERRLGVELRMRGGPWVAAGDWQRADGTALRAGVFLAGGLHGSVGLGAPEVSDRLRVTVGLDVYHLFGPSAVTVYAPTVSLAYSPRDEL